MEKGKNREKWNVIVNVSSKKKKKKKKSLNHNKGTERGEQGSDLGVKGQASDTSAGVEGVDVEQLST